MTSILVTTQITVLWDIKGMNGWAAVLAACSFIIWIPLFSLLLVESPKAVQDITTRGSTDSLSTCTRYAHTHTLNHADIQTWGHLLSSHARLFPTGILPSIEQFIGTWVMSQWNGIDGCPAALPVSSAHSDGDYGQNHLEWCSHQCWTHRWTPNTAERSEMVHSVTWCDVTWHST